MSIADYKQGLGEHGKDTKLNLSNIFGNVDTSGMTPTQFYGTALSLAYTIGDDALTAAIEAEAEGKIEANVVGAAKLAATLMAMNNIYYRFLHLSSDKQFSKMPAGLRMNGMANPGVDKADFELYSLAVSALNGCGMCIDSHVGVLLKHDISAQVIQNSIKMAAVLNAAATARRIA
ncbi:carboxymuconolactone decarboxylase family protein [Pseudidiomarina sp. 1ASP75-14]|uniref:carboxymuconolactone decarboxylase family protein n=1 Tax=Pseudidiomarina terrestris TaxID=2820060 RepID=UPI002656F535|nr:MULTISPECIES: carboxymuconolactone decarboxylase family protein [unclassified Pseudidiomarina]MDN7127911.1 carboxymuconolactone decarboxylase family protein [Pseudidiomarina sp. 1APR75-33.1]MDN7137391.1 carboxymuconolactone decarboxylase family protein [Pseudidiomarina sp. 1ASP75-14]